MALTNTCAPGATAIAEKSNPWILGSFWRDFCAILLPALLGFFLSRSISYTHGFGAGQLALFIVYGWIDSGHVWTTLWRTHAVREERIRRPWATWLPLLITVSIAAWLLLGIPGFWIFAVTATLFHNQRQLWGFLRWYEKLSGTRHRVSAWFFAGFVGLPVAAYAMRPLDPGHFYLVKADIPHFSFSFGFWAVTAAWFTLVFAWAFWELFLYFGCGLREWGRCFALGATALIYGYAFFGARTVMDIAFPLVLSHGVSYLAVMIQTSRRLRIPLSGTQRAGWAWLLGTALAGGLLAYFLLEEFEFENWNKGPGSALVCIAVALYFGPTLSHYFSDSWLWTGRHPDAALIFGAHPSGFPDERATLH